MKKIVLIILSVTILSGIINAQEASVLEQKKAVAASIHKKLSEAKTSKDSLAILYDEFDASPRNMQPAVGRDIYNIAGRLGDTSTQLDICRLLSACYKDDEMLGTIQKEVESLPKSQEQKETVTFFKMSRLSKSVRRLSEAERQKRLTTLLNNLDKNTSKDALEQLFELYSVVCYLRNDVGGDMLQSYVDRLVELVNSPSISLYALRNLVYSEASMIYSDSGDSEKAVAADRKLLEIIAGLEKEYQAKGRKYRNYDINKYVCYRRMLRNAKALSPEEIDNYYNLATELTKTSPEVKVDAEKFPQLNAWYYFAKKDYIKAIPQLKLLLSKEKAMPVRRMALEMLITAAEKTGDNQTKLEALSEYKAINDELDKLRASQQYKELKIKYDVKDLQERNDELELSKRQEEIDSTRNLMTFVIAAFIVIVVVLVLMLFYWSRFQKNATGMGSIIKDLNKERDKMRTSLYSDYMDDIDPLAKEESLLQQLSRKNMAKFEVSTFMTESILNNLLFIASIGRRDRMKYIIESSVESMLKEAAAQAHHRVDPSVKFVINYPEKDLFINTDNECMVFMLEYLFVVAAKYTNYGNVTVDVTRRDDKSLSFAFKTPGHMPADSGTREIFGDFITIENLRSRFGWGLMFDRMVALLLNTDLSPDKTYMDGTCFIFTVPTNIQNPI